MYIQTLRMTLILVMYSFFSNAQTVPWGHKIGGTGQDVSWATKVAPNGNVYVSGKFSGTTDLDPSAAVYNITSNGAEDIFLACYSATGAFQWGFGIGGVSNDGTFELNVDLQSNVIIVGYFQSNVDFDPSAGVALLVNNGVNSNTNWGGDGFIAKYTSTGAYVWSHNIGGNTDFDWGESIVTDAAGNIYFGGSFTGQIDIDPSPGVVALNSATGKTYLVKYTANGQLIWGHNFLSPGMGGVNSTVRSLHLQGNSLAACGFFQNTADLDPMGGVQLATALGYYDAFVANYDTAGNLIFAHALPAAGSFDFGREVTHDPLGNIYVIGHTGSGSTNMSFGTTVVNAPGGGGTGDVFLAKYTHTGTLVWAKMIGGTQEETGEAITYSNGSLYCTGGFGGTVDFDPNVGVSNLVAGGSNDIFVAKYDLDGNYLCGFAAGSTGSDAGWDIDADPQGNIYVGGHFSGTVDFDPTAQTYSHTSANAQDAFLMKYIYATSNNLFTVVTDTICAGETAYVTFTDTAGAGPFTITLSDGSNSFVYPNIQSGVAFPLSPSPLATTTYTWSIAGVGTACFASNSSGSFTVEVNPKPLANAGPDITECNNSLAQLNGSGGTSYTWTPASVLTDPNIANPTLTVTDTTITFTLVTTNVQGCSDTDQVTVSVHTGIAVANAGPDSSVCPGNPIQLQGSGNGSYQWYPPTGLNNPGIADPTYTGNSTATITLVVTDQYNCKDTDEVVITMLPVPTANAGPDVQACAGASVQLQGTGGGSYNWYPNSGMTGGGTSTPTVTVTATTTYYVTTTNNEGCSDTDAVVVSAISVPMPAVSPPSRICSSDSVTIYVAGGSNHFWFPDVNISSTAGDTVVVWPGNSTTYYVVVTEPVCGYIDTLEIEIDVNPSPNVQIDKAEPIDCAKPYGQLAASGAKNYVWTPANTLNDPAIAAPLSFAKEPTWYTVMGISEDGCVGYDSALVDVVSDNMDGFFLPTVFSPNADGKNDCYRILLPPGISEYELHIYNRWGNNVFNADDPSDCWDGTYNGEPCDVGVYMYYYILKSPVCGEKKEGKGDITLLR